MKLSALPFLLAALLVSSSHARTIPAQGYLLPSIDSASEDLSSHTPHEPLFTSDEAIDLSFFRNFDDHVDHSEHDPTLSGILDDYVDHSKHDSNTFRNFDNHVDHSEHDSTSFTTSDHGFPLVEGSSDFFKQLSFTDSTGNDVDFPFGDLADHMLGKAEECDQVTEVSVTTSYHTNTHIRSDTKYTTSTVVEKVPITSYKNYVDLETATIQDHITNVLKVKQFSTVTSSVISSTIVFAEVPVSTEVVYVTSVVTQTATISLPVKVFRHIPEVLRLTTSGQILSTSTLSVTETVTKSLPPSTSFITVYSKQLQTETAYAPPIVSVITSTAVTTVPFVREMDLPVSTVTEMVYSKTASTSTKYETIYHTTTVEALYPFTNIITRSSVFYTTVTSSRTQTVPHFIQSTAEINVPITFQQTTFSTTTKYIDTTAHNTVITTSTVFSTDIVTATTTITDTSLRTIEDVTTSTIQDQVYIHPLRFTHTTAVTIPCVTVTQTSVFTTTAGNYHYEQPSVGAGFLQALRI